MKEDHDMLTTARAARDPEKSTETEVVELSTIPTEALARLDRLATASVLAAGLAHEIANPLSCLLSALDAIERRVREVRRNGATEQLESLEGDIDLAAISTAAITDIVHDFQRFMRPERAQATPAVDPREAVQRALRIMSARLHATARVDVQLREVPFVRASTGRIVQILLNLLLNATEALATRTRSQNLVSVRLDAAAGRVLIEVSDNGPGLSAAVRERIFDAGVSHKPGVSSTGLGLAISRELVDKMGGEIAVSSLPGAGTTFLVSIPSI
jgi:two-component system NtrC family sensor kinase